MAADPRLSDKELAAINAAAVTREYRVQPHLGASIKCRRQMEAESLSFRLSHSLSDQRVS